jgi:hypothetical protein
MMNFLEREYLPKKMVIFIQEIFRIIKKMVMEFWFLLMAKNMKAISRITCVKGKEYITLLMVINIKENLKMIIIKDKACIQ